LVAATSGVALVMWLVYVELFRLDAICLYCTAVHVITVLLFITIALGTVATAPTGDDERQIDERLDDQTRTPRQAEPASET
jgi:hypothetical protein